MVSASSLNTLIGTGGLVVGGAVIADEDPSHAVLASVLALEMLHDCPAGRVHAFPEYRAFL